MSNSQVFTVVVPFRYEVNNLGRTMSSQNVFDFVIETLNFRIADTLNLQIAEDLAVSTYGEPNQTVLDLADRHAWLKAGIENGWITDPYCDTHDGVLMTEAEQESFDEGDDPCIHSTRLLGNW